MREPISPLNRLDRIELAPEIEYLPELLVKGYFDGSKEKDGDFAEQARVNTNIVKLILIIT